MTHTQRSPNRTHLCLEWIEWLFWLVPLAVVTLAGAAAAVAAYLSSGLVASGCARLIRFGRRERFQSDRAQGKTIPAEIVEEAAYLSNRCHGEFPICHPASVSGRLRRSKSFRMGLPGCLPMRDRQRASGLSVPRSPGAPFNRRRDSNRF